MFCGPPQPDFAKRKSNEIERWLREEAKREKRVQNLLLLGTGESGKTTILKQMKILHINGFSREDRREKIEDILSNVHEAIYEIVSNMDRLCPPIEFESPESCTESANFILNKGVKIANRAEYTEEYYNHVQRLWSDGGVKECCQRSNEYQLIESAEYFLDNLRTIRQSVYIPSVQDLLYCRVRTKVISSIEFSVQNPLKYGGGEVKFRMHDVGGQRGERKKWISMFENITAVLYVISCSDFDQTLREDETQNRLTESLSLFRRIFWNKFLRKSGMIVFLNKQDLLKKKIESGRQLNSVFPEYDSYRPSPKETTTNSSYEKAALFLRQKIKDISEDKPREMIRIFPGQDVPQEVEDKEVYTHFTTATDTNNIKLVFSSVHEIILLKNIRDINNIL